MNHENWIKQTYNTIEISEIENIYIEMRFKSVQDKSDPYAR